MRQQPAAGGERGSDRAKIIAVTAAMKLCSVSFHVGQAVMVSCRVVKHTTELCTCSKHTMHSHACSESSFSAHHLKAQIQAVLHGGVTTWGGDSHQQRGGDRAGAYELVALRSWDVAWLVCRGVG
jgi:hypothetical protein